MLRQYLEMGFRSEKGREWRDGGPKSKESFIAVYVTCLVTDQARHQIKVALTVDRRMCPEIARILSSAFIDKALEGFTGPDDIPFRVLQGMYDFKNHFQSHPFDRPDYLETMKEVNEEQIRLQMRS